MTRWMDAAPPQGGTAQRAHFEALRRHAAVCPHCTARARFVEQNFPPMPDLPVRPAVRALRTVGTALKRLPQWLRATVVGSVGVGVLTIVRGRMSVAGGARSTRLPLYRWAFFVWHTSAGRGDTYARSGSASEARAIGDHIAGHSVCDLPARVRIRVSVTAALH